MSKSGRVLEEAPALLESCTQDCGSDSQHTLSAGSRPAHTGAGHAGLELFTATLDGAAADGPALLAVFEVTHTALVVTKEASFFLKFLGTLTGMLCGEFVQQVRRAAWP